MIRIYVDGGGNVTGIRYLDGTPVENIVTGVSIKDSDNPYTLTYYAQWTPIYYTVNILDPDNGTIDAYLGGVSKMTFSARYGDVITIRFTPDSGYEFYRWYINGEGDIDDTEASATSLVVTGNCTLFAMSLGPQLVKLYVYFNGGLSAEEKESFEEPTAMFRGTGGSSDVSLVFDGWSFDANGYYAQYRGFSSKGDYEVGLFGESGIFYKFKDLTVNDDVHSAAIFVYTVMNEIKVGSSDTVASAETGLEAYPEFVTAGSNLDVYVSYGYAYEINVDMAVSGQYESIGSQSGTMDNTHSENLLSFQLPAELTGGILLTGTLTIADKNTVVHIYWMDIGGTDWSLNLSKTIVHDSSATSYSGTYDVPDYDGFVIDPAKSETMSGITAFSISGGNLTYTIDSGRSIELYYERLHAQALLKVEVAITVLSDMTGWIQGTVTEGDVEYVTYQKKVYYGETVQLPTLSRSGYSILPWDVTGGSSLAAEGSYVVGKDDVDESGSKTVTLKANMSKDLHTLTLITQYGAFSNGTSRKSIKLDAGTPLQSHLETPVLSGQDVQKYTFAGWVGITEAMPDHDVSYYAAWIPKTYKLTFTSQDSNTSISATNSAAFISSGSSVNYGEYVTVNVVFATGYTLDNYTVTGADIGDPVQGADRQHYSWSFFMTDNVNITVSSQTVNYRVFFVVNGVLDESLTHSGTKYSTYEFDDFQGAGYSASPWYKDSACNVPLEVNGTSTKYSLKIVEDVTLYTNPTPNTYTVRFHSNGEGVTGSMDDQSFTYGTAQRLRATAFEYEGHKFIGWAMSADGVFKYARSDTVSNLTVENGGIVDLYAVWVSENSVTVKYDGEQHRAILSIANGSDTPLVVYYGTVALTSSNYETSGSTTSPGFTDVLIRGGQAESNRVYYYATVEVDGHTSIVSGSTFVMIEPREVTITSGSSTRAYIAGEALVNHSVTYSGDGFVTGQGVTITYTGSQTDSGSSDNLFDYVFTPVTNGNNYVITKVFGTLKVNEATGNNIEVDLSLEYTYGDAGETLSPTYNPVNGGDTRTAAEIRYEVTSGDGTVITMSGSTITVSGAGTATIRVYVPAIGTEGEPGYYEEISVDVLVTVAKKTLVLAGLQYSDSKVYDGTKTVAVTNIGALDGVVNGDIIDHVVSASYDSKDAGSRTIYVTYTLSGEKAQNYRLDNPDPVAGTISKRQITITSGSAEKVYDGSDLVKTEYSLSSGSFATGEGIASVTYTGKQKVVGSSTNTFGYTLTNATNPSNYAITKVEGTLKVTMRYIEVPEPARAQTYTGAEVPAFSVFTPSTYYTISGTGKDLGPHDATLVLKDKNNTMWVIGDVHTTDDQTVTWYISRAVLEEGFFEVDISSVVYSGEPFGDKYVGERYKWFPDGKSWVKNPDTGEMEWADGMLVENPDTGEMEWKQGGIFPDENGQPEEEKVYEPRVQSGKYILGTDYTVSYSNNVNAGMAVITITGLGGYEGSKLTYHFEITPHPIGASLEGSINFTYNGTSQGPTYSVYVLGDDEVFFVASGDLSAISVGSYELILSGLSGEDAGNYRIDTFDGKIHLKWYILPRTAYVVAGSAYGNGVSELSRDDVQTDLYMLGVVESDMETLRSCLSLSGKQVGVGSSRNTVSLSFLGPVDAGNPTDEEKAKLALMANYDLTLIDGTLAIFERATSSVTVPVEVVDGDSGGDPPSPPPLPAPPLGAAAFLTERTGSAVSVLPALLLLAPILLIRRRKV